MGLKEKVGLFCKKILQFLHYSSMYRNVSLYRDIFGAMHRYLQILYRPISS